MNLLYISDFSINVPELVKKRRMRYVVLNDETGGQSYSCTIAVSGYGSYSILRHEHGIHVLETPLDGKKFKRINVNVIIAPQPDIPSDGKNGLAVQADETFAERPNASQVIVRRYRKKPSPLVRDSIRNWRTGRLQMVLDGDFDLVG